MSESSSPNAGGQRGQQDRLADMKKMASVGQLAGGIVHELSNPLSYIDNNLSSLGRYTRHLAEVISALQAYKAAVEGGQADRQQACAQALAGLEQKKDLRRILDDIPAIIDDSKKGIEQIKNILGHLRIFAGRQSTKPELSDLNKLLDGVLSMVAAEKVCKAEIKRQHGPLPLVECVPQQLAHAFVNVIRNAFAALPDAGTLTVTTGKRPVQLGEPGVGRRQDDPFRPGEEVVSITIADTGAGMPADIRERIFEPFFSTSAGGLGLGLSLSYDIVQQHHGRIFVESEVGEGTRVTILLPLQGRE